jgi:hypothetical protein
MVNLSVRRKSLLALSAVMAFVLVPLSGSGLAIAADRLVLAENFARTT